MAADPLRVYLRRDQLNASAQVQRSRFFYLPVRSVNPTFPIEPIMPKLPGNDSRTFAGVDVNLAAPTSPNFGFHIGRQQLQLNVSGTMQPLDAADYPSLPVPATSLAATVADYDTLYNRLGDKITGNGFPRGGHASMKECYEIPTDAFDGSETDTATAVATTARQNRLRLIEWLADQGRSDKYANFRLGIRDWVTDGKYVEFRGFAVASTPGGEEAALFEQFDYTFNFVVCDTVEVYVSGA